MTSLTQVSYVARKSINIGGLLLILIIVIRVSLGLAYSVWQHYFPPPPPAATVAFGKLPYPTAENSIATPSAVSYTLETIDGGLPEMPPNINVYFIPQPSASFGTFQRMITKAGQFGFSGVPQKVQQNVWRFTDQTNPLRTMDIDEISGDFRIVYNFVADPTLFQQKFFSTDQQAIDIAKSAFGDLLEDSGYEVTAPIITYFRYDSGVLSETTSLSQADAIGVSFVRTPIDEVPVASPELKQGLLSAVVTGETDSKKKILEMRYFYEDIDVENFATYPVISSTEAFEQLKNGNAVYANLPQTMPSSVAIREAYLVYVVPYPSQSYLQPMLAFSDQRGFLAYVPLVKAQWLEAP